MNRKEVIEQLKDLRADRKSFMVSDYDEVYAKDVQALDYVIKELERTAPEVPVQEQSVVINLKINNRFSLQKLLNQLGNNHTLGHRR